MTTPDISEKDGNDELNSILICVGLFMYADMFTFFICYYILRQSIATWYSLA